VDSTVFNRYQQPWRTALAKKVIALPEKDRIYMIIGEEFESFKLSSFLTRVQDPTQLMSGLDANPGVSTTAPTFYRRQMPDLFLRGDSFFYAEYGGTGTGKSGWTTFIVDGADRLFDFDVDDRGYIYLSYSIFGWGILKDDGQANISNVVQCGMNGSICTSGAEGWVRVIRTSNNRYYAVGNMNIFDVTDPTHPVNMGVSPYQSYGISSDIVRNASGDRIAAIVGDGVNGFSLRIYSPDAFISGGQPLKSFPASAIGGGGWVDVTTDGTNFFGVSSGVSGNKIWVISPSGSDYKITAAVTFVNFGTTFVISGNGGIGSIRYGGGYLTVSADLHGDWHLFKVDSSLGIQEVDLNRYFYKYYGGGTGDTRYASPQVLNAVDAVPFSFGGKTYIVIANLVLGDVYQINTGGGPVCKPLQ